MKRYRRSLLALAAFAMSCGPSAAASHPDDDQVTAAQKKWCAALAAVGGDDFRHSSECAAGRPSASAPFLAGMAECYQRRHEDLGDSAPDSGALVSDCTETVLAGAEPGDVSKSPVVQARCRRGERCEKLSYRNCVASFNQLDGMQRAVFTSLYNLRAQAEIAACIEAAECGVEAEDPCIAEAYDRRVWLPLSLGQDRGTAPVGAD
jgi:hypothetical protein